MKGRSAIYIVFVALVLFVQKVRTTNKIFICGIIDGNSNEYDAMNYAIHNISSSNKISITLKKFNISERTHLANQVSEFLQHNVITLIEGSKTTTYACALSTISGIPIIRLHGDSRPNGHCEKAMQMSAGFKDYAHASFDILNKFSWKKIALVYEENRLHEAGFFYAISQKSQMIVNFVQIPEHVKSDDRTASLLRAMDGIKEISPEIILLYTNKENIEIILQQKPFQPNYDGYKWILQGQVPVHINGYQNDIVLAMEISHMGLKKTDGSNYNNTSKELDPLAFDAVQVVKQALNKEPCSSINGTAILSKDKDAMLNCMKKVNIDGLTGPVKFSQDGKRLEIELDIVNLRNNSFTKIGTWNSSKGAVLFENILQNEENTSTKRSLDGRKFRVVVVEDAPFVIRERHKDGTIWYEGYCIDLLNELARKLHFTYEIYPSPDGMYGAGKENGKWNGMIGELMNQRADIVAQLTITERREEVVDFTVPYMYYTDEMLLKKISYSDEVHFLQFMNPFHSHVWFAKLVTLVIISLSVFVINYLSPFGYKDNNGRGTSEEFSFFNSVWFTLGCMLQQGPENQPRSLSGRILAGCYWFCILIWVSTYTANLAAFLTVKNAQHPISNLEDLAQSSYELLILNSSSSYETFKTSKYETHRVIWHRIQAAGTIVTNTSQGIQLVRERENYVFIIDGPILRYAANKPPCELTTVGGLSTAAKALAIALQANDPHIDNFSLAILRLHENFFLANLKRKWWKTSQGCSKEQTSNLSTKRIDLPSMLGVYVVLGVGIALAFLTLIAEILWKTKIKQKSFLLDDAKNSEKIRPVSLQKLWGDWALAFGAEISGIVWVTNMSYDWLMVAFGNHQPIVSNVGYPNEIVVPKAVAQSS